MRHSEKPTKAYGQTCHEKGVLVGLTVMPADGFNPRHQRPGLDLVDYSPSLALSRAAKSSGVPSAAEANASCSASRAAITPEDASA